MVVYENVRLEWTYLKTSVFLFNTM